MVIPQLLYIRQKRWINSNFSLLFCWFWPNHKFWPILKSSSLLNLLVRSVRSALILQDEPSPSWPGLSSQLVFYWQQIKVHFCCWRTEDWQFRYCLCGVVIPSLNYCLYSTTYFRSIGKALMEEGINVIFLLTKV